MPRTPSGLLPRRLYAALLLAGSLAAGRVAYGMLPPGIAAPAGAPAAAALPAAAPAPVQALTDPKGMDGFPAYAPDGSRIAFMRDGRIWLMGPSGDEQRPLTDTADAWDVAPVWSPDGKWIAFIRYPVEGYAAGPAELRTIRPAGGRDGVMLRSEAPIGAVAWSPDGASLAYTTQHQVLILDGRTRRSRTVIDLGEEAELLPGGIAWSPDGQTLVYGAGRRRESSADPLRMQLYMVPVGGGASRQLTHDGGIMPDFSPDGARLAFRNPGRESGIYVLTLATGQTDVRVRDAGRHMYFHPRWSPDGQALLLSRLLLPTDREDAHLISAIVVSR